MIQELLPRKITGSVSRETFDSPILGVKKNYQIYLPPGYYRSPQKHFPVLYLFRGHERNGSILIRTIAAAEWRSSTWPMS